MIQQRYQGIHGQQCEDGLVQRWGYDICGHFNAEHDYRPDVFSDKPKMLHGSVLPFATTAYEQWTSKETWNR
jgi:hypothetical protein